MPKKSLIITGAALCACAALAFAEEAPPASTQPSAQTSQGKKSSSSSDSAAQRNSKRTPKPSDASTENAPIPEVIATPKPTFFQKLFGTRNRKPIPTPFPEGTPTSTSKKSAVTRSPEETKPEKPTPAKTAKSTPTPKPEKTAATSKPEMPVVASPTPTRKTTAAVTKPDKPAKGPAEPPVGADADAKEKFRFEQAKDKANEDPQVKSLKRKADEATTEEGSRTAMRAYNKALFEKIRKIDSSVSDRATKLEAAILRRLSE